MVAARIFLVLCLALWCCGCNKQPNTTIEGTLTSETSLQLPPHSTVVLRLTDVSVADSAAEMAAITLNNVTELPHSYKLPYAAKKINEQHRYMMEARVMVAGQVRYATDQAYPVLTQGAGTHCDLALVATGANSVLSKTTDTPSSVFHGEWREAGGVTLYQAGFINDQLTWIEEDRSNGTPTPLHARYDLRGAYVLNYSDSAQLKIIFDERGRAQQITQGQQTLSLDTQRDLINAVRNRAELLRAHVLAASDTATHRRETGG